MPLLRGCRQRDGREGANVKARGGVMTQLGDRRWGRCHGITRPKTPGSSPLVPLAGRENLITNLLITQRCCRQA